MESINEDIHNDIYSQVRKNTRKSCLGYHSQIAKNKKYLPNLNVAVGEWQIPSRGDSGEWQQTYFMKLYGPEDLERNLSEGWASWWHVQDKWHHVIETGEKNQFCWKYFVFPVYRNVRTLCESQGAAPRSSDERNRTLPTGVICVTPVRTHLVLRLSLPPITETCKYLSIKSFHEL